MDTQTLTVALIRDVFFEDDGESRLHEALQEAASRGARLAVLPELPLNPWSPATRQARDDDAEPPKGERHKMLAKAARDVGIGLIGGAIVRDPETGQRRNTALVFDDAGTLVASYSKLHLPEEPGFWETSHYVPGDRPPQVIDAFGLPVGVQICSDVNRPQGTHLLAAMGAEAILAPRATELSTWSRWRTVIRANAITAAAYVLSVNRPGPENDVPIGGPSFAVAPDGSVILETLERVGVVTLDHAVVDKARRDYPGYLPIRARLYADAWREVAEGAAEPDETRDDSP